jgi:hypothetical protein
LEYTVNTIDEYAFTGRYNDSKSSTASVFVIPETITSIGTGAFSNCDNLSSILIPSSVQSMGAAIFLYCDILREIIYLSPTPPTNWTATSMTYVPDKEKYSSPYYSVYNAAVIEMISFDQTEFDYTGQSPTTSWTNNVAGYTASLSMPALSGEVGSHEEWIPVSFTKGDSTFTANVVYRYTIKPVQLTAKVNNASREYGEENPQFSITY